MAKSGHEHHKDDASHAYQNKSKFKRQIRQLVLETEEAEKDPRDNRDTNLPTAPYFVCFSADFLLDLFIGTIHWYFFSRIFPETSHGSWL